MIARFTDSAPGAEDAVVDGVAPGAWDVRIVMPNQEQEGETNGRGRCWRAVLDGAVTDLQQQLGHAELATT